MADLAGKAYTFAHVRDDPNFFTDRAVRGGEAKVKGKGKGAPPSEEGKEKGVPWSGTYGRRGQKVFTTCVLWILMTSPTKTKPLRSARRPPSGEISGSTSTLVLPGVDTSLTSPPQWEALLGSRRRRHLIALPAAARKGGRIHTHVPAGTWRLEWRSL